MKKAVEYKKIVKVIWESSKEFLLTLGVCYLLVHFVIQPVVVHGTSMYPTLDHLQVGIMQVYPIKLKQIGRFDVIAGHHGDKSFTYIKRVIALPGESIYASNDQVYVNGVALEEPYLNTPYVAQYRESGRLFTNDFELVTLKENEYFLMGDNRPSSDDSRFIGAFQYKELVAKDIFLLPFRWMK